MNPIEKLIVGKQMAETLTKLNKHFIKNDSITKKEFMDMQLEVWKKLKSDLK